MIAFLVHIYLQILNLFLNEIIFLVSKKQFCKFLMSDLVWWKLMLGDKFACVLVIRLNLFSFFLLIFGWVAERSCFKIRLNQTEVLVLLIRALLLKILRLIYNFLSLLFKRLSLCVLIITLLSNFVLSSFPFIWRIFIFRRISNIR